MNTRGTRTLGSSVVAAVFLLSLMMVDSAFGTTTIYLQDIDSGLTSPTGNYRWLDVADQAYSAAYQTDYNYTLATVEAQCAFVTEGLAGTLFATNLKPNFAYQLKLVGFAGTPSNEAIGLVGRWWQEEWNGTAWVNGQNLNDNGDGSSPNPNDDLYYDRRNESDPSSPTGLHYKFTGYLVFDYFITDGNGDAILDFVTDSSYHVLWKISQPRERTASDGPIKATTFDADDSPAYADFGGDYYPSQTIDIFGEWERLPVGGVFPNFDLPVLAQMILTEESFHYSGGALAGNWAGAMGGMVRECDNNGSCEYGEDCDSCPDDCITGDLTGCGNGVCEPSIGEDCLLCPTDCRGKQRGAEKKQYCCGDGDGVNEVGCEDPRCSEEGFSCSDIPAGSYCCGDLICEGDEDSFTCEVDCGPEPVCGDGACDLGEQCSCSEDCGTPPASETSCIDGVDNDCDGESDCADPDCEADPSCSCQPKGGPCSSNTDCCSSRCNRGGHCK